VPADTQTMRQRPLSSDEVKACLEALEQMREVRVPIPVPSVDHPDLAVTIRIKTRPTLVVR
jgi:hypothetical protein